LDALSTIQKSEEKESQIIFFEISDIKMEATRNI